MEICRNWLLWNVSWKHVCGVFGCIVLLTRDTFPNRISTFRKRHGASNIGLVYEVKPDKPFFPEGFVCHGTPYEPPQGIHSFPFIFCQPAVSNWLMKSVDTLTLSITSNLPSIICPTSYPSYNAVKRNSTIQKWVLLTFLTVCSEVPITWCGWTNMPSLSWCSKINNAKKNQQQSTLWQTLSLYFVDPLSFLNCSGWIRLD